MSSICSKNDFDAVRDILMAEGIWEYFIFPSINWLPKGQRIAQIIQDVQLRAPSVLFIDDNPMNRNEAAHFAPGLQVSDETILLNMLADPRFTGKDDAGHSRLKNYQLLERRNHARAHCSDNTDFLRSSNIRVDIDNDIEAHIDRAVELINRTNQLNFTKRRLPEDIAEGRAQLLRELRERNTQAGLVRITDKYGDYGYAGFYLLHVHTWRLVHYCFSCRTLGLGVERWLYHRLNRPAISVADDLRINLFELEPNVDWINAATTVADKRCQHLNGLIFARGGCEIQALAHYFALGAGRLETEVAIFSRRPTRSNSPHRVPPRCHRGDLSRRDFSGSCARV